MQLFIKPNGGVRCLYNETLDLLGLGQLHIERGSHVDPDADGQWLADPMTVSFDPEPCDLPPQMVDWELLEGERNAVLIDQSPFQSAFV